MQKIFYGTKIYLTKLVAMWSGEGISHLGQVQIETKRRKEDDKVRSSIPYTALNIFLIIDGSFASFPSAAMKSLWIGLWNVTKSTRRIAVCLELRYSMTAFNSVLAIWSADLPSEPNRKKYDTDNSTYSIRYRYLYLRYSTPIPLLTVLTSIALT